MFFHFIYTIKYQPFLALIVEVSKMSGHAMITKPSFNIINLLPNPGKQYSSSPTHILKSTFQHVGTIVRYKLSNMISFFSFLVLNEHWVLLLSLFQFFNIFSIF